MHLMTVDNIGSLDWGGQSSRTETVMYEKLNEALESARLVPQKSDCEAHRRAALFPVLNPLRLVSRIKHIGETPGALQGLRKSYQNSTFNSDHVEREGFLGDFRHLTGRSMQAYTKAYEKSANSHFSKFSKLLKKSDFLPRPEDDLLVYLAHPLFRYEAIQQYLKGKNIPIFEIDLLHEWAKRKGINVGQISERSVSLATAEEGDRDDDGNMVSTAPGGKLFSRQQVVDTYRNLLPHVLQSAADIDLTSGPAGLDMVKAWDALVALFAVSSLLNDSSILGMADALCSPIMSALRSMQMSPESLGSDIHRFNIEFLNNGFCPSTKEWMHEVLGASAPSGITSVSAKHRCVKDMEVYSTISGIGALLASPANLMGGYGGFDYVTGDILESGCDIQGLLTAAQKAWDTLRHSRVSHLQGQQVHYALVGSMQVWGDDDRENPENSLMANIIPEGEETTCLLNIEAFQRVVSKYLVTPDTKETLDETVFPALHRMTERLRWVQEMLGFSPNEKGEISPFEQEGHLVLPENAATGIESGDLLAMNDMELDEIAHQAVSVGQNLRALNLTLLQGAVTLRNYAVQCQQAVKDAASAQSSLNDSGETAFMAIETQMQALDKAREEYREWAKEALDELLLVVQEQEAFLAMPLVAVRVFADENDADESESESQVEADLRAASATIESLTAQADAQQEASEKTLLDLTDEHEHKVAELEAALAQSQAETKKAEHQAKALTHHITQAERSKMASSGDDHQAMLAKALIEYSESPKPVTAIDIAEGLFPDRLVMLDSARESAAEAVEMAGHNLLRRLLILATEGWDIWKSGQPLYALNNVMPGDVALSESDTNLSVPKLRQQRTFKEVEADGSVREWVMESHNWIDWQHRLYFDVDEERDAFVIGYAGRHLAISSIN